MLPFLRKDSYKTHCSRYMRRNALCLPHMCRNGLASPKCVEACCAVVSWDGADHHIKLQKGRLMRVQKITRADVCVTCVICRNALVSPKCVEACCAVVSWDGGDHHIELQKGRRCESRKHVRASRCFFVFRFESVVY